MKRTLLLTAIVSVLTTSAFASNIVTSKTYVDNRDNLKVDIAQGVGTNNANVGKTLVVNSSGNLELGTPSAGNYVEDSITDGVTTKAPSENAVHDALAGKQDEIPTNLIQFDGDTWRGIVVTNATGTDLVSNEIAIADIDSASSSWGGIQDAEDMAGGNLDNFIPTVGAVKVGLDTKQTTIPTGTVQFDGDNGIVNLPAIVVTNANGTTLNGNTIGFMDSAHTSATPIEDLPDNVVVSPVVIASELSYKQNKLRANNSISSPNGSLVTYGTAAGTPGSKKIVTAVANGGTDIPTDGAVYTAVNAKQTKKTCAGWLDGTTVADATHTDANCVLWNLPD